MDEQTDAVTRRTVDLPGLRVHVVEAGSGDPVLLLHGFPQSSREWTRVIARLAPRAHVIAPDLRGAGATDAPRGRYDLDTMRQDLIRLLDALGIERVAIAAHDWSALAAFSLCLEHPERVSRLVAIAVPPVHLRMSGELLRAFAGAMGSLWFQYVVATPGVGPRALSRGSQRLPRWVLRRFEVEALDRTDVEAYLASLREPARARAGSALYRQLIIPEFVRILGGAYRGRPLHVPTLVLFGAEDSLIPQGAMKVWEEDAPDLRIEFVPGGGHYLVDDVPADVAERVAGFVGLPTA